MQSRTFCFLAIALLAGCGGGAPKTDAEQISQVLKDAAGALADRDGAKACGYLTPQGQQQVVTLAGPAFGGSDCASIVQLATATLAPLDRSQIKDAEPQNVAITGAQATADVVPPSATDNAAPVHVTLQKTADGWRIAALANLPA